MENDKKILNFSSKLTLLENNTNNIVEYIEKEKNKKYAEIRGRKKMKKSTYTRQSTSDLCLRGKSYGTSSGLT